MAGMQPAAPATRPAVLPWVQGVRALAALSVAFIHIAFNAVATGADPAGWLAAIGRFFPFDAGVDIFFVISGFVIVHASSPLFGTAAGPGIFLRRRLTRIVPLYWLMTTSFLAVLWAGHAAIHAQLGGLPAILASYAFIPWPRPDGEMQPALGLGWTLNYEMFFYAVLAPFLLLARRPAVIAAALALVALVACGQFIHFANPQLSYWSSPLILEFCAGMGLAQLLAAGFTLPTPLRLCLVPAAFLALHVFGHAAPMWRPLAFGLPATALIAASVLGPPATAAYPLMLRLGDASYALYLVHPFVMRALILLWHPRTEAAGILYILIGLAVAQSLALLINIGFEKRVATVLRRPARHATSEAAPQAR